LLDYLNIAGQKQREFIPSLAELEDASAVVEQNDDSRSSKKRRRGDDNS
jgi:hypothetical protein